MSVETSQKVTASQLKRSAFLYVRQSTPRQVLEHTESTARQYALRKRAVALGWQDDQVITIDIDLGQSGASSADREGFQKLVMEVSMGRAGIVLGLEVSRLARNSTDWHRLLEICAITDTLILDEDGIYHPGDFNDRLLLGLKGTMSEAELHLIRARMRGGVLNKAKRGELETPLPFGFAYDDEGRVVLDPDQQVQQAIRSVFDTFRRVGSALGVAKHFREHGLRFPRLIRQPGCPRGSRVGRSGTQQGHAHPPQSTLRQCLLLRAHAFSQETRRRSPRSAFAPTGMAHVDSGCTSWLHYMARL
jgi:DNA invertase Pin-like site-specific DNA recombinase